MAAILTFRYRGFSVISSALPVPGGGFTGKARIEASEGVIRNHEVETLKDDIHTQESAALNAASTLAREWIDAQYA